MHILFADDQPYTSEIFAVAFRLHGDTSVFCKNGVEAVAAVRDQAFDAIVLDVEMPEMDGLTAARQIRALPHGQHVPMVLFTGYPHSEQTAHEAGANLLLYKPLQPAELIDHLEKFRQQ